MQWPMQLKQLQLTAKQVGIIDMDEKSTRCAINREMQKREQRQLRRAVKRLVEASIAYSWKGSLVGKDERDMVTVELRKAKKYFNDIVKAVI